MGRARLTNKPSRVPLPSNRFTARFLPGPPNDPYGVDPIGFMSITGIGMQIDGLDYPEGIELQTIRRLSGPLKHREVTFVRAHDMRDAESQFLVDWVYDTATNAVVRDVRATRPSFSRKNITIEVHERGGEPGTLIGLRAATPRGLDFTDLDAMGSGILLMRLVIAYEGIELDVAQDDFGPALPQGVDIPFTGSLTPEF